MKDLINLAVIKLGKKKGNHYQTNSMCSFSLLDSNKSKKIKSSNPSPSVIYEKTFASLNLTNNIYCRDNQDNLIAVRVDFGNNIVLPELI